MGSVLRHYMARKGKRVKTGGKGGLEITSEALRLLRAAPLHVVLSYFIGSIPFALAALYFWSDMSRSAFAHERCFYASLGLAAVFFWMKCWQTVFCAGLTALVTQSRPPRWTARRVARMVLAQTAVQPYGTVLIALAILLMLPFYCVYAFYQNFTVMADGEDLDLRGISRRAWRQALVWPKQNHIAIWLLSPWVLGVGLFVTFGSMRIAVSLSSDLQSFNSFFWFAFAFIMMFYALFPLSPLGCAVAGNIALMILTVPELLRCLLGIESAFTLGSWHSVFNTTFLMAVFVLSYLCMDPVMKAAYVLRCFYGESQQTGKDLLVELRSTVKSPVEES